MNQRASMAGAALRCSPTGILFIMVNKRLTRCVFDEIALERIPPDAHLELRVLPITIERNR
jgi:hypothetical protein